MRPNRCDCCGGKFGLVSHSSWSRRFCSKLCKKVYRAESSRPPRWAVLLAGNVGRGLDWAMSTVQLRDLASHAGNAGS
jgi:hypothetical protein